MRKLIRKILKEEEEKIRAFTPTEIHLFRLLNKENAIKFADKKLTDRVKDLLETLGKKDASYKYYTALYKLNYREAGDYQNLTKDKLVDPRKNHQEKTTNEKSSDYAKAKMPFKGSHLEGYWSKDDKGVEFYAITSYGWYPIYLFKNDVWYQVTDKYSSTTAKQMSNSNPLKYNNDIGRDMIMVTADEMKKLIRGATYEDIMKGKVEKLIADKGTFISKKSQFATDYSEETVKIRFKIEDVKKENDKAVVYVLIEDAGKQENRKMIPSKGAYLRNEVPGATKEKVENRIKKEINSKLTDYIGPWTSRWHDIDVTQSNIEYRFKHSFENS